MKRILVIVNKKSGTTGKNNIAKQIEKGLDQNIYDYDIVFTEYKGHARELSRQAVVDKIDVVVAVGGDGSVNEIAESLIHTSTALGILPKGSGNGLARSLKIPLQTSKALALINQARTHRLDIGFINEHLFLSNAGIGFDAIVTQIFEENKTRGLVGYLQSIPKALVQHKKFSYELFIDGEKKTGEAFMINIANGNQMGYHFKISPEASPFDGTLDIAIIEKITPWQLPPIVIKSFTEHSSRHVKHLRGKALKIYSDETINFLQTDGEVIPNDKKELHIQIEPKALKIIGL